MKLYMKILSTLSIAVLLGSACSAAPTGAPQGEAVSALTQDEAAGLIDRALQALNTGDYNTWSQDWDETMKDAIKEGDFQTYRDQVVEQYGNYVSLESIEILPGQNEGFVRWVAVANFENGKIQYSFGFLIDGDEIMGIFPEPVQ